MKTPDGIKKGLECKNCDGCPYDERLYEDGEPRCHEAADDALAYIQQLERERDAAVALMREFAARINAGEDVPACEYCSKEFEECNCNCLKDFELR